MSKNMGKKGVPKRIFLIGYRSDYYSEQSRSQEAPILADTVNVAINVPVDNKKNAFFGDVF